MRLVIWDFDGTLAERPGRWGGCLTEAAGRLFPDAPLDRAQLRSALGQGFPWHAPMEAHTHLNDPDEWWATVQAVLTRACVAAGLDEARGAAVSREARTRYAAPGTFKLYDDSIPALDLLRDRGWHHAILSNHIPELPEIVEDLGLGTYFDAVVTSAAIGYDKPHPQSYRTVLDLLQPAHAWMVGDNPDADVAGAEAVGLPALLIDRSGSTPEPLLAAATTILSAP